MFVIKPILKVGFYYNLSNEIKGWISEELSHLSFTYGQESEIRNDSSIL